MRSDALSNEQDRLASVLREWAALGERIVASARRPIPSWEPVAKLIDTAREKLRFDARTLQCLLHESRTKLNPLSDPFDIDLGSHRWLAFDREEVYSDWLAWIVGGIDNPQTVYELFGLGDIPAAMGGPPSVQREFCVPHGHEDQRGRLDLVLRYGDRVVIVIEVKCGNADDADTAKQGGYWEWLKQQTADAENRHAVIVANAAVERQYEKFEFRAWESVCIGLRRHAAELVNGDKLTRASLALAFVAAVEQNLLGFSAQHVRNICSGELVMFDPTVVEHLRRFVEEIT